MKKVFIYTLTANSSGKPETNNILMFSDVEYIVEGSNKIKIYYTGKSTGTFNKAIFLKANIAGYTITGSEDVREEVERHKEYKGQPSTIAGE